MADKIEAVISMRITRSAARNLIKKSAIKKELEAIENFYQQNQASLSAPNLFLYGRILNQKGDK